MATLNLPAFTKDFDRTEKLLASLGATDIHVRQGRYMNGHPDPNTKYLEGRLKEHTFSIPSFCGTVGRANLSKDTNAQTGTLIKNALCRFKPENYPENSQFQFRDREGRVINIGFVGEAWGFLYDIYIDGEHFSTDLYKTNSCPNFAHVVERVKYHFGERKPDIPPSKTPPLLRLFPFLNRTAHAS